MTRIPTNGFLRILTEIPTCDEEVLPYLAHPTTTQYQDLYLALRRQGTELVTAFQVVIQIRQKHIQVELANLKERERRNGHSFSPGL